MLDQTAQQTVLNSQRQNEGITRGSLVVKPKTVHAVITGKGGVGKSFIASMLTQYLLETGEPVAAFDVDPCQSTLSNIDGLPAESIEILDGDTVNVALMDACFTRMLEEENNFVLDSGAAGFVAFMSYLLKDRIFEVLIDEGKRVVVHAVVVGGGVGMLETMMGLNDLLTQFPKQVDFILWLNPFFGPLKTDDGKLFEDTPWWLANKSRFSGVIRIPDTDYRYTGAAIHQMLTDHQTFARALESKTFERIAKIRLRRFWDEMKSEIWAAI